MFEFKQLEVVHWDFWQRFKIPLDTNIITVIGPNGSGKTTLLDAFRVLLTIECSSGRDYKRYVRRNNQAFLRAVVGNRSNSAGRHPFFPLISPEVTLLCRILKKSGEWKRQYMILEGDVSIDEAQERADWLGVRDYARRLDSAGLTQAIKRVLALEQGDTDKLCEFSPKALLSLVFDVFGDKEALDNYQQAKTEQYEISRELEELQTKLASMRAQLNDAESQVNNYNEYQRLNESIVKLETETLSQVEYAQLKQTIKNLQNQLKAQRELHSNAGSASKEINAEIKSLEKQIAGANELLDDIQNATKVTNDTFLQIRDKTRAAEHTLSERDRLIKMGEEQNKGFDLKKVQNEQEQSYQKLSELRQERQITQQRLTELRTQQKTLHSGHRILPENVTAMITAMNRQNIAFTLLSDIVDIKDEKWQPAIEGLLRPYRYLLLLDNESDKQTAWKLGQKLRYPHFITAERIEHYHSAPGTILNTIEFAEAPPEWLPDFLSKVNCVDTVNQGNRYKNKQWITPDGYFCERRGARHIGVEPRQYGFGKSTQSRQAESVTDEIQKLSTYLDKVTNDIQKVLKEIASRESLIKDVDSAKSLQARAVEFADAESELPLLQNEAHQISMKLAEQQEQYHSAVERKHTLDKQLTEARKQLKDLASSENASVITEKQLQDKLVTAILRYRRKRLGMAVEWRNTEALKQALEEYPEVSLVRHEVERMKRHINEGHWVTDDSVIGRRDKIQVDVNNLDRDIKKRGTHHYRLCTITDDARESYINVLRATIRVYSKNLKNLGQLAGIEVEVNPPNLENDDVVLAQAGLDVRFNFDQKGLIGLNDGEASGGQQVMKSLILLVALMKDEQNSGGFVFIDEPFAHLDIFNIDKVGAFLESTQAQYVLTTPNTHNINIFNPTGLTLVTQKRKPNTPWAPPIGFVERLRETENKQEAETEPA